MCARPDTVAAMRRWAFWACRVGFVCLTACGSDESLTPPTEAPNADAGVDLCAAFDALLDVPGVPERLCASNQDNDTAQGKQQCALCAAGVTAATTLLPIPSCPTELTDCPLSDTTLRACFKDVGQLMTEALPGCTPVSAVSFDPMNVALRVATSSCGPVIVSCPALQDLVFALLGATL